MKPSCQDELLPRSQRSPLPASPPTMSATIQDLPDALLGRILGLCGLRTGWAVWPSGVAVGSHGELCRRVGSLPLQPKAQP